MEILELDPRVLHETASLIERTCEKQRTTMDEYMSRVRIVARDWNDETFDTMLEEINRLKNEIEDIMSEIQRYYPGYFREKAEFIERRKSIIGG